MINQTVIDLIAAPASRFSDDELAGREHHPAINSTANEITQ